MIKRLKAKVITELAYSRPLRNVSLNVRFNKTHTILCQFFVCCISDSYVIMCFYPTKELCFDVCITAAMTGFNGVAFEAYQHCMAWGIC